MKILGIDLGMDGGLSLIDGGGGLEWALRMPVLPGERGKGHVYDEEAIVALLLSAQDDFKAHPFYAYMEKLWARGGQMDNATGREIRRGQKASVKSNFTSGFSFGFWRGLLLGLGIETRIVTAQKWQGDLLKGYRGDSKDRSRAFCQDHFPGHDFTPTPRSRVAHSGMTDSACIAYWGLKQEQWAQKIKVASVS